MNIAVTGATGQLGQLVIQSLKTRVPADQIIALVRNPAKAEALGVQARAFDYTRSVDDLAAALQGIDRLLLISSNEIGQRAAQHGNVVKAAEQAGVGQIVYTSLLRADCSPLSLAGEHVETEAALKASTLPHVILRNGWYAENYTGALPAALAHGALIGAAGEGRVSAATRQDYADAAAVVLTTDGHAGKTYELAADTAWTLADLAAELSAQSGKQIPYHNLSQADYAAALVQVGLPEGLADAIAGWDIGASKDALFDDSRVLSGLIGRPTTSLADAVRAAL